MQRLSSIKRKEIARKVNEIVDYLTAMERTQIVPTAGGKWFLSPGSSQLNLSGFLTREEAIQAGVNLPQ